MSITITDPALLAQFAQAGGFVEVKDPAGNVLGTFLLKDYGKLPPGVKSPFTDEEVEAARREPSSGRALADILRDLKQKYGE